ncbi:MAG: signal peptidase I [Chlorobium phaeobacteroides]|uniref:Signal peptidase I n=1 Tax=Chlorobium phaeobacteroides (strain BS1) TaxID=331678 RepID=B3EPG9_CHLPB|nr:signal peptidase I [Chlorobium phaeobacteroides]MBL6955859.1 signal peptidase I [Chlorobium phaeobacteroides]
MAKGTGKTGKQHSKEWFEALLIALLFATVIRVFVVESYRIPTGSMERTLLAGDFLFVNKFVYGAKVPFTDIRLPQVDSVERGDIIVFKFPKDRSLNYIKRCIAVSGDTLEIKDRTVLINGQATALPEHAQFLAGSMPAGYPDQQIFPRYAGFNKDNYGPLRIPRKGDVVSLNEDSYYLYAALIREEGHTIAVPGGRILVDGKPADTYTIEQNYYFALGDNRDNSLDSRFWGFLSERDVVGQALMVYWSWDPNISFSDPVEKVSSIRWQRTGMMVH